MMRSGSRGAVEATRWIRLVDGLLSTGCSTVRVSLLDGSANICRRFSAVSLQSIYRSNLNVIWVVQSSLSKIFRFPRRANQLYQLAPSHLTRGADRESSRTRGGMRWTRQRWARDELARRRTAQMRTAKSCGSGIRCCCQAGRGFASRTGFR
jgi:hypothetical protein